MRMRFNRCLMTCIRPLRGQVQQVTLGERGRVLPGRDNYALEQGFNVSIEEGFGVNALQRL